MKYIKLTKNQVAIVDDEDFERINKNKWYAGFDIVMGKYYARRGIWLNKKVGAILMHRFILNTFNKEHIDHINGNTLDNRKDNLRICTVQQNQFNQKNPRKDNKLGIKGVYLDSKIRKFVAQIKVNGKLIYLGCFNVAGDADSAYRKAEEKYFGEFARNATLKKITPSGGVH